MRRGVPGPRPGGVEPRTEIKCPECEAVIAVLDADEEIAMRNGLGTVTSREVTCPNGHARTIRTIRRAT